MSDSNPVALITGGAKRIGHQIASMLHASGYDIMIHYRSSQQAASALVHSLNEARDNSAAMVQGDLLDINSVPTIVDSTIQQFDRLDAVINNASTFYPTPIELINEEYWNDLVGSNLKAPAFIAKHAVPYLRQSNGCIVNIIDIYGQTPLSNHPLYCSAKSGLSMLTKSLARDLAPEIRVNGVSPGAVLWPENNKTEFSQDELLKRIPMQRMGSPEDIAKAVRFLLMDADYITGQIIAVDGGRSVVM